MTKKWEDLIWQCFGLEDWQFAGYPSDEETAFELLAQTAVAKVP